MVSCQALGQVLVMGQTLHLLSGNRTFAGMMGAGNQAQRCMWVVCLVGTGRIRSPVEGGLSLGWPGRFGEVSHRGSWAGKEERKGILAMGLASSKV